MIASGSSQADLTAHAGTVTQGGHRITSRLSKLSGWAALDVQALLRRTFALEPSLRAVQRTTNDCGKEAKDPTIRVSGSDNPLDVCASTRGPRSAREIVVYNHSDTAVALTSFSGGLRAADQSDIGRLGLQGTLSGLDPFGGGRPSLGAHSRLTLYLDATQPSGRVDYKPNSTQSIRDRLAPLIVGSVLDAGVGAIILAGVESYHDCVNDLHRARLDYDPAVEQNVDCLFKAGGGSVRLKTATGTITFRKDARSSVTDAVKKLLKDRLTGGVSAGSLTFTAIQTLPDVGGSGTQAPAAQAEPVPTPSTPAPAAVTTTPPTTPTSTTPSTSPSSTVTVPSPPQAAPAPIVNPSPTTTSPLQVTTHYDCGRSPDAYGHYVPNGRHWGNDFVATGSSITGGSLLLGANSDGAQHSARIGIYTGGPIALTGELGSVVVAVSGYGGVSFTFPTPIPVSPGKALWLAATGVGDFTAYDRNDGGTDGCLIGSLTGSR